MKAPSGSSVRKTIHILINKARVVQVFLKGVLNGLKDGWSQDGHLIHTFVKKQPIIMEKSLIWEHVSFVLAYFGGACVPTGVIFGILGATSGPLLTTWATLSKLHAFPGVQGHI